MALTAGGAFEFSMQTHTTPVLLGFKDRAELAGSEYTSVGSVLEGAVIVEKVPDTGAKV